MKLSTLILILQKVKKDAGKDPEVLINVSAFEPGEPVSGCHYDRATKAVWIDTFDAEERG